MTAKKTNGNDPFRPVSVKEALLMPTHNDPNCLLGKRFLCRGSGGVIVGASGAGKSSFALQFACHLAMGLPFFGIKSPHKKPLQVLLVQAENDEFEVAEVLQSITEEWSAAQKELLDKNLHIYCLWEKTGRDFAEWLGERAGHHKIDVAFVDPLMSYCGCDVLNNQAMGEFLRQYINGHLKEIKNSETQLMNFGLIFVHHTGKQAKSSAKKGGKDAEATSYNMLGASELTNWARFVMNVDYSARSTSERRVFDLSVTKRGNRSELFNEEGPGKWRCRIQHSSKQGIKPADGKAVGEESGMGLTRIHWEAFHPNADLPAKPSPQGASPVTAKPAAVGDVATTVEEKTPSVAPGKAKSKPAVKKPADAAQNAAVQKI